MLRSLVLSFLILNASSAAVAYAQDSFVRSEILQNGDIRIWEEGNPPASVEDSLANLFQSMGSMQWWAEPILTMLPIVLATEDGSSGLDIEAMEALSQNPPSNYAGSLRDAFPGALEVDSDGTMERIVSGLPRIEQLRAFFERIEIPAQAADLRAQSDPANLRILEAWLTGAQAAAATNEALFYQRHPAFAGTNLLAAFRTRTLDHLLQYMIVQAKLYDAGALIGTARALSNWDHSAPLGVTIGNNFATAARADTPPFPEIALTEARGASNGAAFVFRDAASPEREQCVTIGEPHQPSIEQIPGGPSARPKIFQLYPRRPDGTILPALVVAFGGGPAPFLSYSRSHATSGTASPTFGSLTFFAETNGTHYLDTSLTPPAWRPFTTRTISYTWRGEPRSFTIYGMEGFGDVFIHTLITNPEPSRRYAVSMRTKIQGSVVDAYIGRLRHGVQGDAEGYLDTLKSGGLQFYSEAGCHPVSGTTQEAPSRRAYYALNQGRTDVMPEENDVGIFVPNSLQAGFQRSGSHDTPLCSNQRFTTADNGAIAYGCSDRVSFTTVRDPGGPTWRQLHFTSWAEEATSPNGQLTRDEVVQFATSTESLAAREIALFVADSLERFAGETVQPPQLSKALSLAEELRAYDGVARDTPTHLLMLYLNPRFLNALAMSGGTVPPAITNYFLRVSGNRASASASLTAPVAGIVNALALQALEVYEDICVPAGVTRPSEAMRVLFEGDVVASGFTGPHIEARNSGGMNFIASSSNACQLLLTSTSPFSFVAFDDEVLYRTYGPNASPHTLSAGLYQSASEAAWSLIARINKSGAGYSSTDSLRNFSLSDTSVPTALTGSVVISNVRTVRSVNLQAIHEQLSELRSLIRKLLRQNDLRSKRARKIRKKAREVRKRVEEATVLYRETIAGGTLTTNRTLEPVLQSAKRALRTRAKSPALRRAARKLRNTESLE